MPQSEKVTGIDPAVASADLSRRPETVKVTGRVTPCRVSYPLAVAVTVPPASNSGLSAIGCPRTNDAVW